MSASKFTPENRGALIERTAAGVSLTDACRALDIRKGTVKSWLTRGRREEAGQYAEFAEAVEEARRDAKQRADEMDAEELARVVSEAARKGSVQAMKLRHEMLRTNEAPAPPEADEFDELRARRATLLREQLEGRRSVLRRRVNVDHGAGVYPVFGAALVQDTEERKAPLGPVFDLVQDLCHASRRFDLVASRQDDQAVYVFGDAPTITRGRGGGNA